MKPYVIEHCIFLTHYIETNCNSFLSVDIFVVVNKKFVFVSHVSIFIWWQCNDNDNQTNSFNMICHDFSGLLLFFRSYFCFAICLHPNRILCFGCKISTGKHLDFFVTTQRLAVFFIHRDSIYNVCENGMKNPDI